MRRILNLSLATFGLIAFLASCSCGGVDCQNGGTCNEGTCDCLKGYYGDNCELKDFCEINEVECVFGECTDGNCNCLSGYEGEDCSISSRAKYIGEFKVFEEGCSPLDTLTNNFIYINEDIEDPSKMVITQVFSYANWDGLGFYSSISATPTPGTDNFKIPNQEPDGNGNTISGNGTITAISDEVSKIKIDYTVTRGNKTYTCYIECETFIP